MDLSPNFGSQNALTSPAANIWEVEVCRPVSTSRSSVADTAKGVPFHPENQPPKAPCPYCSINNRDQTAKILYAIRGVSPGQYDDSIPKDYLQVPPPQLGQPGNEALRVCPLYAWPYFDGLQLLQFQYVSLLRFASKVHERLLASEKELKTWKDRESSIVACLAATEPLGR